MNLTQYKSKFQLLFAGAVVIILILVIASAFSLLGGKKTEEEVLKEFWETARHYEQFITIIRIMAGRAKFCMGKQSIIYTCFPEYSSECG